MKTAEQLIREEKNPEILRELALFILQQSNVISAENNKLRALRAKEEAKKQAWLNKAIEVQIHKLRRRFFEGGRETLSKGVHTRDRRGDELLLHAQSLAGKPDQDEKVDLPIEERTHVTNDSVVIKKAQLKDPTLKMEKAKVKVMPGFFETSTEITITERTYKKITHKKQKYSVKNTETGRVTIVTAPGPIKLLPGSRYSIDFALSIVGGKFLNHMPLDRQRKDMARLGLKIPVMTMFRLTEQVALHMEEVAEAIRLEVFSAPLAVHLDETPWKILNKDSSNGQMWVVSNQSGSYYRFEPARTREIAEELLKGYVGPVMTDKHSAYLYLRDNKNNTWGLCWSHARREFFDLQAAYPAEVEKIVTAIDELFSFERKAKAWEELKIIRETLSADKCAEIKKILENYHAEFFDGDDFCKAINYVLNAWAEFTAFLIDVQIPLSNNDAERALRHAVLGRKSFNGSKTINGADVAATLYTIIVSAKKVQIDPIEYMKYVITENQCDRKPLTPLKYALEMRSH